MRIPDFHLPSSGDIASEESRIGTLNEGTRSTEGSIQNVNQAIGHTPLPELTRPPNPIPDDEVLPPLPRTAVLPTPSTDAQISRARPGDEITLWRGGSSEQVANIQRYGTAGGVPGVNPEVGAPSQQAARNQVAGASRPGYSRADKLPEYTNKPSVANGFSTGCQIVAVGIQRQYLTEGSRTEGGWVADPRAPVEVKGVKQGRPLAPNSRFGGVDAS
jgi:hypothetical protein